MRSGSCPQQQMRPAGPPHFMRRTFSIYLPIVVTVILLPAIALASPPHVPNTGAGIDSTRHEGAGRLEADTSLALNRSCQCTSADFLTSAWSSRIPVA